MSAPFIDASRNCIGLSSQSAHVIGQPLDPRFRQLAIFARTPARHGAARGGSAAGRQARSARDPQRGRSAVPPAAALPGPHPRERGARIAPRRGGRGRRARARGTRGVRPPAQPGLHACRRQRDDDAALLPLQRGPAAQPRARGAPALLRRGAARAQRHRDVPPGMPGAGCRRADAGRGGADPDLSQHRGAASGQLALTYRTGSATSG
jgi:hypothetical protein